MLGAPRANIESSFIYFTLTNSSRKQHASLEFSETLFLHYSIATFYIRKDNLRVNTQYAHRRRRSYEDFAFNASRSNSRTREILVEGDTFIYIYKL